MSESHRLFEAWQLAEHHASHSCRELFEAHIAFTRGAGPPPPPALAEEATFRRALAHDLLRAFLTEMERESAAIRADTHRAWSARRDVVDSA